MEIFTEKKAEDFLEKENFEIVERAFVREEKELKKATEKIGFPLAMKISSGKIVHKTKLKGVETNINNYEEALKIFSQFRAKDGFEEVIIQKMIKGNEFLIGLKKTKEFGHAVVFGVGGIYTEKLKEASFRICPIEEKDAEKMINEIKSFKDLNENTKTKIITNILKTSKLSEKYPNIIELDINPLIINEKQGKIVDARIVFE